MKQPFNVSVLFFYTILIYLVFLGFYDYLADTPCFMGMTYSDVLRWSMYSLLLSVIARLSYKVNSLQQHVRERTHLNQSNGLEGSKVETAWHKVAESLDSLEREQQIKDSYISNLLTMANCTQGIALWVKDAEHRYKFADDTLRNTLLKGNAHEDVVGRTDAELIDAHECTPEDIVEFLNVHRPDWLPKISQCYFEGRTVCNITDVITKQYKIPCRFVEEIGDKVYDVWKTPLVDQKSGDVVGTVGCLVDITHIKEQRAVDIKRLEADGEAFRIDSTPNFYIKRYQFGDLAHLADSAGAASAPQGNACPVCDHFQESRAS